MSDALAGRVAALGERTVREAMRARPALARSLGDHSFDGQMPPIGPDALRRRVEELDRLAGDLDRVAVEAEAPLGTLDTERRADLRAAQLAIASERFHLVELRDPATEPRWALDAAADVSSYVSRDYEPAPERAAALCRHLDQLPGWLPEAAALLDGELPAGPRMLALDGASGYASYLRQDVRTQLGPLPGDVGGRLDAAVEAAAQACEGYRDAVLARGERTDATLGAALLERMLVLQEGVRETAAGLRTSADAELDRLTALATEVAADLVPDGDVAAALELIQSDHPGADGLLATAAGTLDELRRFWLEAGAVSLPADARCEVRATPAYRRWSTASYEPPGVFAPPGLPHYYFVTPVQPDWTAAQSEQWLRHLNHSSLEIISVHEAYPGHFVHELAGSRQPSPVRVAFWGQGFGEGWAHYTEELAVEHGLALGRPRLHLAQIQDALLRACRMRTAVGLHTEGWSVEDGTRLFMERAHLDRLPAEREALRGTHDPMYLLYTYGKLEILRWREELRRRPGFDLRTFHDACLSTGFPPLAVVRDLVL